MSIEIKSVRYFSAADVQRELGVTRQTLWRWRRDGKVPLGRRYRDRRVLYTKGELEAIREYANRLAPVALSGSRRSK